MTQLSRQNSFFIICIYFVTVSYGQITCDSSNLFGEWAFIRSFMSYVSPSTDSLIKLIDCSTSSTNTCTYYKDGTYIFRIRNNSFKRHYVIDQNSCKIYTRRRRKSKRLFVQEIIMLDNKRLIIKKENPHAYSILLFRKT